MKSLASILLLLHFHTAYAQPSGDSLISRTDSIPERKGLKKLLVYSGLTFGYSVAVYYCFKEEDSHFQKETQEKRTVFKDKFAHSISPLGVGKNNWMAVGATAGLAYLTKDIRLQKTVAVWAGSLAINDAVTNKLKEHVQRYRPNTGLPHNTFDRRRGPRVNRSFPSAHASNAFTTATVFASMYKDKHWVAPVAYGAATMVSFSRVYNNAHWASDIMAGAAIGFLSAKAMVALEKHFSKKKVRLYPQLGPHGGSIGLVKQF